MSPLTGPGGRPITPGTVWPPTPNGAAKTTVVVVPLTREDVEDAPPAARARQLLDAVLPPAPAEPEPEPAPGPRPDGMSAFLPQPGRGVTCTFETGHRLIGYLEAVIRDRDGEPTHLVLRRVEVRGEAARANRRIVSLRGPVLITFDVDVDELDQAVAARIRRAEQADPADDAALLPRDRG